MWMAAQRELCDLENGNIILCIEYDPKVYTSGDGYLVAGGCYEMPRLQND